MIKSKPTNHTFYVFIALCVFCAILVIDASHPLGKNLPVTEAPALMATTMHRPEKTFAPAAVPAAAEVSGKHYVNAKPAELPVPGVAGKVELPVPQPAAVNSAPLKTYTVEALVTAYCPCARCCGAFANGRTSTGTNAWRPGIAVDPATIPYGSIITVPGYGTAKADDTGYAMRQSWDRHGRIQIDVRFQYHWQARQWGKKTLLITVTRPATSTFANR